MSLWLVEVDTANYFVPRYLFKCRTAQVVSETQHAHNNCYWLVSDRNTCRVVHLARDYNKMVKNAKMTCTELQLQDFGQGAPCSRQISMHYSFDYAQQVLLPSDPMQPGPLYFLVPRKCSIFGVCCEGLPRQMNFVDEAHLISKGSNSVVSNMHNFFERFGLGETDVDLHCENCSGQNKNRFVLWYCAWRVANGLHKSITLNFLVVGHTQLFPDSC